MAEFEVKGGRELRRSLKQVEDGLKELKAIHKAAADVVVDRAREIVPVGTTGALAQSIRPAGTASAAIVRAGGAKVPYANVIHWGWPRHNIVGQPFLTSAAADTESTWVALYEKRVDELLSKVKGA